MREKKSQWPVIARNRRVRELLASTELVSLCIAGGIILIQCFLWWYSVALWGFSGTGPAQVHERYKRDSKLGYLEQQHEQVGRTKKGSCAAEGAVPGTHRSLGSLVGAAPGMGRSLRYSVPGGACTSQLATAQAGMS